MSALLPRPPLPSLTPAFDRQEDRVLNSHKKPALKKLTLLPQVVMHLKK